MTAPETFTSPAFDNFRRSWNIRLARSLIFEGEKGTR